jgi:predicted transcriptional regulator with HTH domain
MPIEYISKVNPSPQEKKMTIVKNPLSPIEYAALVKETGAKKRRFIYLLTIGQLEENRDNASNQKVASYVCQEQQTSGRVCNELAAVGLIKDVSTHPGRRNWRLTETGKKVFSVIRDANEIYLDTIA